MIDLRVLAPLDLRVVEESLGRTGKVLIVHEAPLTGGFGGEIAARLADRSFDDLDAPPRRLAYPDTPIPCNPGLEAAALPGPASIAEAAAALARF